MTYIAKTVITTIPYDTVLNFNSYVFVDQRRTDGGRILRFCCKKKFAILAQMKNDIKLTYKHTHKAKCKRTLHKA